MSGKDQLLITFGIIALIAVALLTSVGRNLFSQSIPSVVLPDTSSISDRLNPETNWHGEGAPPTPVTVTTESVQDVIASLSRSTSYSREMDIELFWEGGSSTTTVAVWQNGNWISTQQTTPSGLVRCDLIGNDMRYYWYDGDSQWCSIPETQDSIDLAQRIPTYEDVLAVDSQHIVSAQYTTYHSLNTIYVEVEEGSRVTRYWISTSNGLLVGAETDEDGVLIYRLTGTDTVQTPCPSDAPFSLPNGTALSYLG